MIAADNVTRFAGKSYRMHRKSDLPKPPDAEITRVPTPLLHVGIDATSWANDRGFGRFTRELVTSLASRSSGFRYTLLFDRIPEQTLPAAVEILNASTQSTLTESAVGATSRSIGYLWKIGKLARKANFDLFFFPSVYSYFPILARVPCVVCYHDTTAERFPELVFPSKWNRCLWQLKTALARLQTTRAMTVSQTSAMDLEQILRIQRSRIDIVTEAPNPVFHVMNRRDVSTKIRSRYIIPETADLLVYVGGLNPHKNLLGILKAMREVIPERPEVHLIIAGDISGKGFWDNIPDLKRFVHTYPPLERHVRFTGYLSDLELAELLNDAEALVFPSLWEGFGLPAVEAMACGLPVLASRSGSLPEIVGDAGLFFDPEDPSDIASCVLRFLGNPELPPRLREMALKRAHTFSWDRAADLAEQCFRRCHEDASRR